MPVDYSTLQRLIRPLPAHEHERLTCPKCGYDVRQTLIDGFGVCPECGAPISVRVCKPSAWDDSRWATAFLFGIFLLPTVMVVAAPIVWRFFGRPVAWWWFVAGAAAGSYVAVVACYRYARLRMGEHPSVARSFLDGALVVLLNAALMAFVVLVASLFV